VTGFIEGQALCVGTARLLGEASIDASPLTAMLDSEADNGATPVAVAIAGRPAGVIAVADPVRASTPAAIAALKAAGITVAMLTGDRAATARAVARRLQIADVEAELLPADKVTSVERRKQQGQIVAMAGDGINDAPALASADVGIAMGTGTDVAMHSAGITLLQGDLAGIVRARALSTATMANIRQNLAFAFIYNIAGVPLAAGLLYPLLGLTLSPVFAAAAMALSSVSVIGNALRLKRLRL
jgi:Cu+-exporting ATPase